MKIKITDLYNTEIKMGDTVRIIESVHDIDTNFEYIVCEYHHGPDGKKLKVRTPDGRWTSRLTDYSFFRHVEDPTLIVGETLTRLKTMVNILETLDPDKIISIKGLERRIIAQSILDGIKKGENDMEMLDLIEENFYVEK